MQIASFMLNYIPLKRPLFVGLGGGGREVTYMSLVSHVEEEAMLPACLCHFCSFNQSLCHTVNMRQHYITFEKAFHF